MKGARSGQPSTATRLMHGFWLMCNFILRPKKFFPRRSCPVVELANESCDVAPISILLVSRTSCTAIVPSHGEISFDHCIELPNDKTIAIHYRAIVRIAKAARYPTSAEPSFIDRGGAPSWFLQLEERAITQL